MKEYLLHPIPAEDQESVMLRLDPKEPYLAHHDVGVPLFGTVMSLEAMCEACAGLEIWNGELPNGTGIRLERIRAGEDCLVPEAKTLTGRILRGKRIGSAEAVLTDQDRLVFRAFVTELTTEHPQFSECLKKDLMSFTSQRTPVLAREIYQVFFHGPAFQVVREAYAAADTVLCCMEPDLAFLSQQTCRIVLPVRMIEFALQSSGLYDLAYHGAMSVPLGIDAITVFPEAWEMTAQKPEKPSVYSMVHRHTSGSDIDVFDKYGRILLRVEGYHTKPMPYEGPSLNTLQDRFLMN